MNSVPRCACGNAPSRACAAPVYAPEAWPNSSLRIRSGLLDAQSNATCGPLRPDSTCKVRAATSLPVPPFRAARGAATPRGRSLARQSLRMPLRRIAAGLQHSLLGIAPDTDDHQPASLVSPVPDLEAAWRRWSPGSGAVPPTRDGYRNLRVVLVTVDPGVCADDGLWRLPLLQQLRQLVLDIGRPLRIRRVVAIPLTPAPGRQSAGFALYLDGIPDADAGDDFQAEIARRMSGVAVVRALAPVPCVATMAVGFQGHTAPAGNGAP